MAKLAQVLAVEKNVKNRVETDFTKIHQALLKTDLINGMSKTYQPKDEDGEKFPPESKKVVIKAEDEIKRLTDSLTELFDTVATKDLANCNAKADVVVDGRTILTGVPATHLLFIEKKLVDLATFAKKLPELDQAENWHVDTGSGFFATDPITTAKGKKIVKHVVVVPPTAQHPAQIKDDTEDVTIGHWTTVKFSSALQRERIGKITERIEKLAKAVKYAREEANSVAAPQFQTGAAVLNYIFEK